MISLPPGFDVTQLIADFFTLATPFVSIAFVIATGFLIISLLKK